MLTNLKLLRHEFGISQQRLADAIQVTQPSINKYENHNIEPDIGILIRLAEYFNTSIDYIVGRTDIRRPIEHTEPYHLNSREAEVITQRRALSADEVDCVQHVIQTLLKK